MPNYYDGSKLLSLKDINGETPEIYMVTSNRSAGKTTFFHRYLFRRFLKYGERFALLYRFSDMLDDLDGKFFKDIGPLFFPDYVCKAVKKSRGLYVELYTCKREEQENPEAWRCCGYGLPLNTSNKLKNFSHYFSDVARIYFDEFQAEGGEYCPKEVDKFQSIHTTIARGNGEQSRAVPVIMSANTVSIINPYFTAFGISNKIQKDTKFLRGSGFVLECNYNEDADKAQSSSAFARAFGVNKFNQYQNGGTYALDASNFVEKMRGDSRYTFTLLKSGKKYGAHQFPGCLYIDKRVDGSCKTVIAGDIESHAPGAIMGVGSIYRRMCLDEFNAGRVRFYDLETRSDFIDFLTSYYK